MYLEYFLAQCRYALSSAWRVALLSGVLALPVHADILISPQRVIMDADNRQANISLHNPGKATRAYSLSWVERRFEKDGQQINLKAGENPSSIASMVRFSPRRVVIEPGQTQKIRLDYRPPADLKPGEYRSHLRIGMEPLKNGASGTEVMRGEKDGMSFRLEALLSFTLPVFVRHGSGMATVQISGVEPSTIAQNGINHPALKVNLTRSGDFSVYGRLVVYQQLDTKAPVEEIGEAGGVAIYAEIDNIKREVPLKPGTRLLPGSWVRLSFEGEGPERGQVFAERAFQIGK